jgi:hypothetical protein
VSRGDQEQRQELVPERMYDRTRPAYIPHAFGRVFANTDRQGGPLSGIPSGRQGRKMGRRRCGDGDVVL